MEGNAIHSCSRLTFAACIAGICASTARLGAAAPSSAAHAGAAASTAAPAMKSRRLKPVSDALLICPPLAWLLPVDGALTVAQHVFLDLARGGFGQLLHEVHGAGHLKARQVLATVL